MTHRVPVWRRFGLIGAAALLSACTGPAATLQGADDTQPGQSAAPPRAKSLTIGITGSVPALSIAGGSSPVGGWVAMSEMHSDGLITSDVSSPRPVGRLAERVPTVDDGSISLQSDGRMRVVFNLRKGGSWQDGAPFTAQDLVFSYQLGGPNGIPTQLNNAIKYMASVEAPDDGTFVVSYKQPWYLGATVGPRQFWPVPRHLLTDAYQRYLASKDANDVLQDPYWTTAYVGTGPFRLTQFDPAAGLDFQAYDGYFLGRPKIDTVYVRIFNDEQTFLANILSGTVDLAPELALRPTAAGPLRDAWNKNGGGTIYVSDSSPRHLSPQVRPAVQIEPAVLDPRVRAALYYAIDRETISDAVNGGNPQLAAWSILPSSAPLYGVTKDTLRPFGYAPERGQAQLRELGWIQRADGRLRNDADGRGFRTSIWASVGADPEIAAYASYWRKIGLEVEEHISSPAEARDSAARSQFPGFEVSAIPITGLLANSGATAENRWSGNRNGYEDPQAQKLANAYFSSITPPGQLQAMRALNEFFINQMLSLPIFFPATYVVARKGVTAFDDFAGGTNNENYGSYYRNSYLWDVQ